MAQVDTAAWTWKPRTKVEVFADVTRYRAGRHLASGRSAPDGSVSLEVPDKLSGGARTTGPALIARGTAPDGSDKQLHVYAKA
jgi:hypothetical protein